MHRTALQFAPEVRITGTSRSSTQTLLSRHGREVQDATPIQYTSCEVGLKALGSSQSPSDLLVPGPKTPFNLNPWKPSSRLERSVHCTYRLRPQESSSGISVTLCNC